MQKLGWLVSRYLNRGSRAVLPLKGARRLEVAWTANDRDTLWRRSLDCAPREGAVLAFCSRSTGRSRDRILIRSPIRPCGADLAYDRGDAVTIRATYLNRLLDRLQCEPENTGIAVLHTHPGPGYPEWSRDDDVADEGLAKFFYGEGFLKDTAPLLSLVASVDELSGRELTYDRKSGRVSSRDVERIQTVGRHNFELKHTLRSLVGSEQWEAPEHADRSVRVFGRAGQHFLSQLHIAVVGTGGVGSIVAEHLARFGVGQLSLWDPDIVSAANINRSAVFTFWDAWLGRKKVRRLAQILPAAALLRNIRINWSDRDVRLAGELPDLLDADLIVMLVDDVRPRHFINRVSYSHYIPVLDAGNVIATATLSDGDPESVSVEGGGVRVNLLTLGGPCLWCCGHIDPEKLARAFRSDHEVAAERARGYVENLGPEHAPSVMPLNALTAGLLEVRLQDYLFGLSGRSVPEVHYSLLGGTLDELPRSQSASCRNCAQLEGGGDFVDPGFAD